MPISALFLLELLLAFFSFFMAGCVSFFNTYVVLFAHTFVDLIRFLRQRGFTRSMACESGRYAGNKVKALRLEAQHLLSILVSAMIPHLLLFLSMALSSSYLGHLVGKSPHSSAGLKRKSTGFLALPTRWNRSTQFS